MNMVTGFDRRHSRGVILIRVLVTAWLLALTGILLAYGYWGWALLTLARRGGAQRLGLSRLPGDNALDTRTDRPRRISGGWAHLRVWPLNCDVLPLNIKGASRFLRKCLRHP